MTKIKIDCVYEISSTDLSISVLTLKKTVKKSSEFPKIIITYFLLFNQESYKDGKTTSQRFVKPTYLKITTLFYIYFIKRKQRSGNKICNSKVFNKISSVRY